MIAGETIAAIATAPGRGAIAIVRCSGPDARAVVGRVFRSREPLRDRTAVVGEVLDVEGRGLDQGLAIAMFAPRSVTGEDVVELHVHGSPVIARETLRALLHAGARAAGPGEFTRRAFLNGKLDLSAAEAVADVIAAESREQARAARANLIGGLRAEIEALRAGTSALLEELAGAIDYPDEVPEPAPGAVAARLEALRARAAALVADWERGRIVREGLMVAIVGPPNAGKSSLLNALLAEERAIVSEVPGTTRDVIEEQVAIGGQMLRLLDTAGLRDAQDAVERMGIDRAEAALDAATAVLVVVDGSRPLGAAERALLERTRGRSRIVLFNKADRGTTGFAEREAPEAAALSGSVREAATLDAVREALRGLAPVGLDIARPHLASARQADAVARTVEAFDRAAGTIAAGDPVDLIAFELLAASAALGEVTGGDATEALLDGIFARFCVGK